jgi:hypothetical protein
MLYTFEFLVALVIILAVSFSIWALMWHDEVKCNIAQRKLLKSITALEPIKFSSHEHDAMPKQSEVIQFDSLKQQATLLGNGQQKQKKRTTNKRSVIARLQ